MPVTVTDGLSSGPGGQAGRRANPFGQADWLQVQPSGLAKCTGRLTIADVERAVAAGAMSPWLKEVEEQQVWFTRSISGAFT